MVVLDSSAAVDLFVRSRSGNWVEERLRADHDLHTPQIFDLEVTNILRRFVLSRRLDEPRAEAALAELVVLNVARYPHVPLLSRVWQLRHDVSAYDAAYVALAEALGAPLLTTDRRLARTPGLPVDVIAP